MPHELLGNLGVHPATGQARRGLVAEGVEVEHRPAGVVFRYAGGREVGPHHLSRPPAGQRERPGLRHLRPQVPRQHLGGGRTQRQTVEAAALAVRGLHRHRSGVEVERRPPQAAKLIGPQTGLDRQAVQHGPLRPGHAVMLRADFRGLDQPAQLIVGQRAAGPTRIGVRVGLLQEQERALGNAALLHGPLGKALQGHQIVVARLHRQPGATARRQVALQLHAIHLADQLPPAGLDHAPDAVDRIADMLRRAAGVIQLLAIVGDVLRHRLARQGRPAIDQAPLVQLRLDPLGQAVQVHQVGTVQGIAGHATGHQGLDLAAQRVRGGLVRKSRQAPLTAVVVLHRNVPPGRLLAAAGGGVGVAVETHPRFLQAAEYVQSQRGGIPALRHATISSARHRIRPLMTIGSGSSSRRFHALIVLVETSRRRAIAVVERTANSKSTGCFITGVRTIIGTNAPLRRSHLSRTGRVGQEQFLRVTDSARWRNLRRLHQMYERIATWICIVVSLGVGVTGLVSARQNAAHNEALSARLTALDGKFSEEEQSTASAIAKLTDTTRQLHNTDLKIVETRNGDLKHLEKLVHDAHSSALDAASEFIDIAIAPFRDRVGALEIESSEKGKSR